MDSARTAFYVAGSVLLLAGLAALGAGLPAVLSAGAGPVAAFASVVGAALTTLAVSILLTAAGDGAATSSTGSRRTSRGAEGSAVFTITPATPYPALACWTGSALLLLLVLTRWQELGTAAALAGALVVGFTARWGQQSWRGYHARTRG